MSKAISLWNTDVMPDVPGVPAFLVQQKVLETIQEFCEYTEIYQVQLPPIKLVAYMGQYPLTSTDGIILSTIHAEVQQYTMGKTSQKWLDDHETDWRNGNASLPMRYFMNSDRVFNAVYTPNQDSWAYETYTTELTFTGPDTITNVSGGFLTGGLATGQIITVSGTTSNNKDFTIVSLTENQIKVTGGITTEGTADVSAIIGASVLNVWVALKPLDTATTVPDILYTDWRKGIGYGARWKLFGMPGKPWTSGEMMKYWETRYMKERSRAWHKTREGRTQYQGTGVSA
jgi:hypothetical protein